MGFLASWLSLFGKLHTSERFCLKNQGAHHLGSVDHQPLHTPAHTFACPHREHRSSRSGMRQGKRILDRAGLDPGPHGPLLFPLPQPHPSLWVSSSCLHEEALWESLAVRAGWELSHPLHFTLGIPCLCFLSSKGSNFF